MILITAAMAEELQELLPEDSHASGMFPETRFGKQGAAAVIGTGKVLSACRTGELLERYRPERVVHIGICGALTPGVQIGEFIMPSWTVQHDLEPQPFSSRGSAAFLPYARIELNSPLRSEFAASLHRAAGGGTVHPYGGIATGDAFITGSRRQSLAETLPPGEPAVCDMETFCVAAACRLRGVDLVVMKAVSDDAHGRRVKRFSRFLANISRILCRGALLSRQDN